MCNTLDSQGRGSSTCGSKTALLASDGGAKRDRISCKISSTIVFYMYHGGLCYCDSDNIVTVMVPLNVMSTFLILVVNW